MPFSIARSITKGCIYYIYILYNIWCSWILKRVFNCFVILRWFTLLSKKRHGFPSACEDIIMHHRAPKKVVFNTHIYIYIGCHSVCWWSTYFNFMFIMFLPFWGPLQPTTGIIDPFFFDHRKLPASLYLVPGCDVSSIGGPRIGCHHFSGRLHRTRSNYVVCCCLLYIYIYNVWTNVCCLQTFIYIYIYIYISIMCICVYISYLQSFRIPVPYSHLVDTPKTIRIAPHAPQTTTWIASDVPRDTYWLMIYRGFYRGLL